MEDSYNHPEDGLAYIESNIPGIGIDETLFNTQPSISCDCKNKSCFENESCSCVKLYGVNFKNRLLVDNKLYSNSLIIECNSFCSCSLNCGNRLVQLGPRKGLVIFKDLNKGFGVKSEEIIKSGSFICEYSGELIGKMEAKLRSKNNKDKMNFIFVLREFCNSNVLETIVDATKIGNIGRYINHSCEPNSVILPVRNDSVIPKLAIFAICDIQIDEEITYNYSGNDYFEANQGTLCYCGSTKCKHYLPCDKELLI
uniref:Histone-lysine N-methyltransferase n=1 Tax=Clastoptera arizonana TaxID=38151 RepID=A0A1B6CA52_9HEMI